ncbi:type II toxin-antitoxin system RelE/ParE family toxin [Candidatus Microgenomates bacterium]|nr:type II toxin-antitoxin system RelE/ParE family toxin [Candidatus Microgenomates bacterium]
MKVIYDDRYKKFVKNLSSLDQGKILRYQDLFSDYGFKLSSKYLKKLDNNLWELRPGNLRLLVGKVRSLGLTVFVHVFKKKSQKTPKKETKTAQRRLNEYEKS